MKKGGACFKEFGPFFFSLPAADLVPISLISLSTTFRRDLLHLPTVYGEHCAGDVINMGEAIGQTVWVFLERSDFIMKLFMREVCFPFLC